MERIVIDMEQPTYPTARDMADTIREAMRAAGVSQGELSIKTGISKNTLNRRLNGAVPTYGELAVIAEALGRPLSALIAETEVRVAARRVVA